MPDAISKLIKAKIETLKYKAGKSMREIKLDEYQFADFNINKASTSGIIEIDKKNRVAYSKWVSPKRTRSYPFARIYDTYSFGGKRITIIPVIKDEGKGAAKNKSNNDRINFITLSWMNLFNVYVILAWYSDAEKVDEYRITHQTFDTGYVNQKIKELVEYQLDAHHWNNEHFIKDFVDIYKDAVSAYENISKKLVVKLHPFQEHLLFLEKIVSDKNKHLIDLEKFANETLTKSKKAARREIDVKHRNEFLSLDGQKIIFEIENSLGGRYYLTADEIFIDADKKEIIIQESKNSTSDKMPKAGDIKDGLFKILLFSQIKAISIDNIIYAYKVRLKLTGKLTSNIVLPTNSETFSSFVTLERLSATERNLVQMLNEEALENNYVVEITNNSRI